MTTAQQEERGLAGARLSRTLPVQNVQGDRNVSVAVGGDFVAGSKYIQHLYRDSDFHEPSLKPVEPPDFESPEIAKQLVEQLAERRLLVLGGDDLPDKPTLALHLAWLMLQRKGNGRGRGDGELAVRECTCGSGAIRLDEVLRAAKSPTLFILQRAEPGHVGYNLEALRRTINPLQHYLLITTDTGRSSWYQPGEAATVEVWRELAARDVYNESYLAHCLRKRLAEASERQVSGLFPAGRPGGRDEDLEVPLLEGLSLREAALELETPDQVSLLVSWLVSGTEPVSEAGLRQEIQRIRAEDAAIGSWFQQLSRHSQRLVVGLLLFEGLFDDQLFAALDVLVQKVWRPRQPALESFDYKDLGAVASYFRLPESENGGFRVEARSPEHSKALFDAVWRFQRRDLLASLPVVSELVCESGRRQSLEAKTGPREPEPAGKNNHVKARRRNHQDKGQGKGEGNLEEALGERGGKDAKPVEADAVGNGAHPPPRQEQGAALSRWEGYGPMREIVSSRERRERLDEVVGRSLGQIAQRSPAVVERCLLELAEHHSPGAQEVAARALASLLGSEREPFLLKTVLEWYKDSKDKQKQEIHRRSPAWEANRYVFIRATTARVLSNAAFEEQPGALPEPFADLLEWLAEDRNLGVRYQLCLQALPALVLRHQRQLDAELWEILRFSDLIEPVAFGWALAHEHRPLDAAKLLGEWTARCLDDAATPPLEPPLQREARLATVALTYGFVNYNSPAAHASLEAAVGKLKALLLERHPFVRHYVFRAIGLLIRGFFDRLEGTLRDLVEGVSVDDRSEIAVPLLGVYLSQRRALKGGQGEVEVDGVTYAVWRGRDRPPTRVESILQRWLTDPDHASAQQIAFDAFTAFFDSQLTREEERWRQGAGAGSDAEPLPGQPASPPRGPVCSLRTASFLDRGMLSLLTVGRIDLKSVLGALVAELVYGLEHHGPPVGRLLSDWRLRRGRLGTLGRHLGYLAFFHRYWPLILISIAVSGIVVFMLWLWTATGGGSNGG